MPSCPRSMPRARSVQVTQHVRDSQRHRNPILVPLAAIPGMLASPEGKQGAPQFPLPHICL